MEKKENVNSSHIEKNKMTQHNTSHTHNVSNTHESTSHNQNLASTHKSTGHNQSVTSTHKSTSHTHNVSGTHGSTGHTHNVSNTHGSTGHIHSVTSTHKSTSQTPTHSHSSNTTSNKKLVINNSGRLGTGDSSSNNNSTGHHGGNLSIGFTPTNSKKKKSFFGNMNLVKLVGIFAIFLFVFSFVKQFNINSFFTDDDFIIISTIENQDIDDEIINFGKRNNIDIKFEYAEDLDAVSLINQGCEYDAIWASNSLWLYQIDKYPLRNSKSISINPVVLAVKKSKAIELGFVGRDITNAEVIDAIANGRINYVMSSVVKSNSGASAYLGFLNSLAGSPEVLKSEMLFEPVLVDKMTAFFSQVERVSGTETFLEDMFLKSDDYDAVIAAETSLIRINQELGNAGKEPLYLLYPSDGVALSDSPFAYIDRSQDKLDEFDLIQKYLLSESMQKTLEDSGRRTWYGGVNENANPEVFNKEWGIDTTKYLIPQKYPSKKVINQATSLYVETFRKPSHTVFLLDYSGSMVGDGNRELVNAMNYILDYEKASKDLIQFANRDKITVIPFTDGVLDIWKTENGVNTWNLLNDIQYKRPGGGTNVYVAAVSALDILKYEDDAYSKTIVLMTDGQSINDYDYLYDNYIYNSYKIPIYSITFGDADSEQLEQIAALTNAKVFDGKTDLLKAFKEVRSFS